MCLTCCVALSYLQFYRTCQSQMREYSERRQTLPSKTTIEKTQYATLKLHVFIKYINLEPVSSCYDHNLFKRLIGKRKSIV